LVKKRQNKANESEDIEETLASGWERRGTSLSTASVKKEEMMYIILFFLPSTRRNDERGRRKDAFSSLPKKHPKAKRTFSSISSKKFSSFQINPGIS
jgi:hypothetical protein